MNKNFLKESLIDIFCDNMCWPELFLHPKNEWIITEWGIKLSKNNFVVFSTSEVFYFKNIELDFSYEDGKRKNRQPFNCKHYISGYGSFVTDSTENSKVKSYDILELYYTHETLKSKMQCKVP